MFLQNADLEFASSLISLLKTIKRGIQVHEDFSGGIVSPAELIVCHFTGIKVIVNINL
jgi:renin receptor